MAFLLTFSCYFDNPQIPWGGEFEQKLSAQFKCPAYVRPPPQQLNIDRCITFLVHCSARRWNKEGLVRTNNDTADAKLRQQKMIATDATLFLIDFHHLQRIGAEEIAFYNNENKNSRPFSLRARECCFRRPNNDEVILFENLDSFLCCLTSLFIFHIIRRQIFLSRTHSKGGKSFTVLNSVLVNKKSIEVGQLFSLGTASNIPEKVFRIP